MFKLPFYGEKKLITAFEYGVVLSQAAKERNIELTPEIIERTEAMIKKEFKDKDWKKINLEMIPNLLATFETK